MLKQMIHWGEYSYSSSWLDDIKLDGSVVSKKELLKNMRALIELGLVRMYRGGLNDDGEVVGGTHYSIAYSKKKEIEELIGVV